jgi:hypothetical protein
MRVFELDLSHSDCSVAEVRTWMCLLRRNLHVRFVTAEPPRTEHRNPLPCDDGNAHSIVLSIPLPPKKFR